MWDATPPEGRVSCLAAFPRRSSAISAIPGVVFSGAGDGHLRAHSTQDGKILWDFDTVRHLDIVAKSDGYGGSIDGGGPAIAGGMVLVNSGYGSFKGSVGNVLVAFGSD